MTQEHDAKVLLERTTLGFGNRTYRANGLTIYVDPTSKLEDDGSTSVGLGFPLFTVEDYVAEAEKVARGLAEYLSQPPAPDLARQVITLTTRAETAEEFAAKADLSRLAYARGLKKLMDAVSSAVIEIEDEGDRVYFGSTNHADDLRAAWQLADVLELEELFEDTQPQTSLAETNLQLQQRAETAEAEVKRLREAGDEVADKLWVLRCNSRDPLDRAAAETAFEMWKRALLKEQGE